jgi:hypothetical protein
MDFSVYGPVFGNAGVWNFRWCKTNNVMRACVTAMNIAGWIPVASLVAGVARLVFAGYMINQGFVLDIPFPKGLGYVAIGRALLEICQVGCVCVPFDLICSAIRASKSNR